MRPAIFLFASNYPPNLCSNVMAYWTSQATVISKATSLVIIHEGESVSKVVVGNKRSCLLTLMFMRKRKGRGIASVEH